MVADAAGRAGRPAGAGLDSNNKGRAVVFMALLALQIGVQPVIAKTCIDKEQVALVSVVVGQELMKLVISFFMLQIECRQGLTVAGRSPGARFIFCQHSKPTCFIWSARA